MSANNRSIGQGCQSTLDSDKACSSRPRLRILLGHAIALGPGKADLLEHIQQTGSISAAARIMGMSYRRAWLLVDTMNHCFRSPLVEKLKGGKGGGGAQVTDFGREVMRRYRKMEEEARKATANDMAELEAMLSDPPTTECD